MNVGIIELLLIFVGLILGNGGIVWIAAKKGTENVNQRLEDFMYASKQSQDRIERKVDRINGTIARHNVDIELLKRQVGSLE